MLDQTAGQVSVSNEDSYDVIVVGSGLGGMTAAAIQARRGKRVLLVEKHKVLGGYASVFGRAGASFDTSLHLLGGATKTHVAQILKDAGVYDTLKFAKPEYLSEVQLGPGEPAVKIPNGDLEGYQAWLCQTYPKEKRAIKRWFWFMRRYGRQVALDDRVRRYDAFRQGACLFFYPILAPLLVASRIALPRLSVAMRVKDPNLQKLLLHFSGYYGAPHTEINALLPMVANYSYYHDGGYYLEGGGFEITRQLSRVIRKNGGRVLTGKAVQRITTQQDQVTGVMVEGIETPFHAQEVVCSANPFSVYENMLPGHPIAQSELARINRMDLSMTACVVFLHIDVPVGELNEALRNCYEYFSMPPGRETEFFEHFRNRKGFDDAYEKDGLVLTLHSHLDPKAVGKDGGGTVFDLFFCDNYERWSRLSPEAYEAQKAVELDKMLSRLETLLPGVRDHIKTVELATPITLQRFTGNKGGVIYGFAQTPEQSGKKRFAIDSPIKGLKFVSAWSNPGGGYEGVLRAADNYLNPRKKAAKLVCLGLFAASVLAAPLSHLF